jgi:hypothetical protein
MLRRLAGSLLPRHGRKALLTSAHWIGGRAEQRVCPLCSWRGRHFAPGGGWSKRRLDCVCPRCGSLERHRLAFLVAERRLRLGFSTVLHVAPEPAIETWLRRRSREYVSIDLLRSAMIRMDVTALALPNRSISLIWCSHVLEHVPEDLARSGNSSAC